MVRSIKNLIAAILISISGFLVWTNILPRYDYSSQIKIAIEAKKVLLESRSGIIDRIKSLQIEYEEKYAELQRLALVIPQEKGLPEFISTLEDMSTQTGVIYGEISIGTGGSSPNNPFNVISFDANFKTSYESLLSFLGYLESNIRLIDITALNINLKKDDLLADSTAPLEVQIKTKTYYLKLLSEIQALVSPTSGNQPE